MANYVHGIIGFAIVFLLLYLRVPLFASFGIVGFAGFLFLFGIRTAAESVSVVVWSYSSDYVLATIPLFVLMGELMSFGGISGPLFDFFNRSSAA